MKSRYIVKVSLELEIEASMSSVALMKAARRFKKLNVIHLSSAKPDGSEECSIHPENIDRAIRLKSKS